MSFSRCSGIQKSCLSFRRFHKNENKKYFFKSENSQGTASNNVIFSIIYGSVFFNELNLH